MANDKKTAEQVQQELDDVKLKLAHVQLAKATMELEQTEETVAAFKAEKKSRAQRNAQRQSQLKKEVGDKARQASQCTHRQGGSVGKNAPKWGKGPSALTICIMPDGRTELIMCSICPLRVFSPDPRNQSKKLRGEETPVEMKDRQEKYHRDLQEFEKLKELAQDKLTQDAAAPMHCGTTFQFQDGDGREVIVPRPCDSYLQGTDNRQGVQN